MKKDDSGYTLVELIVVIVIIAVISGITAISVSRSIAGLDKSSTLYNIADCLETARYDSMTTSDSNIVTNLTITKTGYRVIEKKVNGGNEEVFRDTAVSTRKRSLYLIYGPDDDKIKIRIKDAEILYDKSSGNIKSMVINDDYDVDLSGDTFYLIRSDNNSKSLIFSLTTGRWKVAEDY